MTSLLKTEWLKIKKYPAFWWMTAIVALTYPGINYLFYRGYEGMVNGQNQKAAMVAKMIMGNPFTFPEVWHTAAYASSIFVFIPSIVVIMFITNEYTYKTHRQNIIDGWSRNQFLLSKLIDVLIVSLLTTAVFFIIALIIGYININDGSGKVWEQSHYTVLFFFRNILPTFNSFSHSIFNKESFYCPGCFYFL